MKISFKSTENLFTPNKIRTVSGKYINPLDPDPECILIEDIAHALSMQCRFGGHTKIFYSVAEHSMDVARRVWEVDKLAALLHDASEAYLMDIPSPVKSQIPNYKEAENRLMEVIAKKFGFEYPLPQMVKMADEKALVYEWETFVIPEDPPHELAAMSARIARHKFLKMFIDLRQT